MCASVDSHKLQASNRAFLGYQLYQDDAEFWKRPPLDAGLRIDSEGQGRSREQWGGRWWLSASRDRGCREARAVCMPFEGRACRNS